MQATCLSCKYWTRKTGDPHNAGACHRYPPTVSDEMLRAIVNDMCVKHKEQPELYHYFEAHGGAEVFLACGFANTTDEDWCGEYKETDDRQLLDTLDTRTIADTE